MKTSNVSVTGAAPNATAVQNPTAPAAGGTDFLALITQVIEGSVPAGTPASLPTPALPAVAYGEQDDAGGDLDESDVAAMMATLTGSPMMPAPPATAPLRDLAALDPLQASSRRGELSGAIVEQLALQSATVDVDAREPDANVSVPSGDDTAGTPTVDPRLAQTAPDPVRDVRSTPADAPVQRHMHQTVGTRAWADELGSQVTMMTDRGQQAASLRLSPEHLGPLEIRISIQDDQASVWFGAAHADTRAAIEGALPRLRDMLASQGLALNDAGVFKEAPRQQPQFRAERAGKADTVGVSEEVHSVAVTQLGLVDAYA